MKNCLKCQATLPVKAVIDGKLRNLQHRKFCLICSPFGTHNTRDIRWQRKILLGPTGKYRTTQDEVRKFRQRKKEKMIAYKGGACQKCGYKRCKNALHFHHINPAIKCFEICRRPSWGFEKLKPELDKCILLCSNCHAEVHEGILTL
jgi:5-methylcytosine-specific restriction endonuclease McrA